MAEADRPEITAELIANLADLAKKASHPPIADDAVIALLNKLPAAPVRKPSTSLTRHPQLSDIGIPIEEIE